MTILDAIQDVKLFRPWFSGPTWRVWLTFLKALFALPFDETDAIAYQRHTGRAARPPSAFKEAWLVIGRRGGKSLVASLVAVFLACFRDYSRYLKPGEVGTVAVIAADRKQARTILRYIRGFLKLPILKRLIVNQTQESIELAVNGCDVTIEVHTASWRSIRGYTLIACIADEIAFWRSDESANPDTEIIQAVRPGLATIPNSLLLCISSPYARRGAMWEAYSRHFGKDSVVLVWQAATREMNPSIDEAIIEQAIAEDEPAARAEYFAEFRRDIEAFVSREVLDACTMRGRYELPAMERTAYVAFVDPSGGSSDSMTLAIAHAEKPQSLGASVRVVLDLVREKRPPFSPAAVVLEFVEVMREYGIRRVCGDRYAGEWPREQFRKYGVEYICAEKVKSDLYRDVLPLLNSGRAELLEHPRLIQQLLGLERRTARGGKDSIDHAPRAHDDLANAAAGALVVALESSQSRRAVGQLAAGNTERRKALENRLALEELIRRQGG